MTRDEPMGLYEAARFVIVNCPSASWKFAGFRLSMNLLMEAVHRLEEENGIPEEDWSQLHFVVPEEAQ